MMIQEYLIKDDKIIDSIKDYSSDKINQKISNENGLQILSIGMKGKNKENAKILSEIHQEIISANELVVLNNGCSEYFNKSLFPIINEFERKLRKLLYLAAVISDSDEMKGIENIEDLENKDLGTIFETLFTDIDFNNKIKRLGKDISWQCDKKWLIKHIGTFQEKTLWQELLGNKINNLSNNYLEVKDFRNAVMHAKNIDYFRFLKISNLFEKINKDIDNLVLEIRNPKQKNIKYFENFNIQLSEALKKQSLLISESTKSINNNMEYFISYFSEVFQSIKLDNLNEIMSEFAKSIKDMPKLDLNNIDTLDGDNNQ